jgi:endonuclease/exonuclease/phosphatase family metal-dependent hydrolase
MATDLQAGRPQGRAGFLAGVTLLLQLLSSMAIAAPQPAAGGGYSGAIRLLSWNIRLDTPADGADSWPYRAQGVIGVLQQQQPDVLGLQEVLWHQLVRLESALVGYQRVGVGRQQGLADSRETGEFNPILFRRSRFTLLDSGTFWLNPQNQVGQPGWDAALPRICSWVLLQDKQNGQRWRVLNVHLDHHGSLARREAVLLLSRYLTEWQQQPAAAPAVLMGDFNPASGDGVLQTLASALPQQQDVLQVTPPSDGPAYSFYGWGETAARGVRLDFMLVPPAQVQVLQAQLLPVPRPQPNQLPRHDRPEQRQPPHSGRWSDHLPLSAVLKQTGH